MAMIDWRAAAGVAAGWLETDLGKALLGGSLGGLVRWLTLRESIGDGVVSLVVGAVCAVYLGPLAEPLLAPLLGAVSLGDKADDLSPFVIGLGGVGLAGGVIDVMRRFSRDDDGKADGDDQ